MITRSQGESRNFDFRFRLSSDTQFERRVSYLSRLAGQHHKVHKKAVQK